MKNSDKNFVYSTNPDFKFESEQDQSENTISNSQQSLRIFPDRRNRKGKTVTVISGFQGQAEDLKALEKKLKSLCGAGGTVKDSEILLQGNFIQKIADYLKNEGYKVKISGI